MGVTRVVARLAEEVMAVARLVAAAEPAAVQQGWLGERLAVVETAGEEVAGWVEVEQGKEEMAEAYRAAQTAAATAEVKAGMAMQVVVLAAGVEVVAREEAARVAALEGLLVEALVEMTVEAVREVPDIDHGVCSTLLHRSRRHQRAHCCRRGTSPPMAGVRSRCTSCPWCTRAGTPRDPRIGRRSCLGRCLLSRSIQRAQHTPWARQVEAAWEALKAAAAMAVWVAAMGLAAGVEDGIRASSRALSSHCTWCQMAIP